MSRHITFLDFHEFWALFARNSSLGNSRDSNGSCVPRPPASRIPDIPAWSALTFHRSHLSTGKKSVFNPLQTLNSAWESPQCLLGRAYPSRSVTSFALITSIRRPPPTTPANESRRRISPTESPV